MQISVHQSASAWYQLIRERGLGRARETDLLKPFASDVSIDQPNDVGNANAKPSLRPTLAAFAPPTLAVAATRNEGANTMIMERGARPDTLPKPERGKAVLIVWLGVAVGLVLGLGLGIGLGAALWSIGALGATHTNHAGVGVLSACERFFQCSTSDADEIPGPEELETMSAQRQARYAEPKWGTP